MKVGWSDVFAVSYIQYLTELTAEELHHITKESEAQTSHTRTPAPSKTSEDTAASEPEKIQVLSPEPPSTGEQRLAVLAELLHISPQFQMSNMVTVQEATATQQSFGVLDPITGRMMDPDKAAIHRAIRPDQPCQGPSQGGSYMIIMVWLW